MAWLPGGSDLEGACRDLEENGELMGFTGLLPHELGAAARKALENKSEGWHDDLDGGIDVSGKCVGAGRTHWKTGAVVAG